MVPTEPAYLTNRAAAYIAIKRFRPALADCQQATSLQTTSTGVPAPPKTLLRLARCQLALAQTTAALSTLRGVLAAEPGSAPAVQMHAKALELEAHVRNLEASRRRGEWAMARVALDRCLLAIEAEGSEIPTEWRLWQVEIELGRGNWDGANSAAKCVLLSFILFIFIF
jgi:DnaJ homolog subfamily C member 7